MNVPPIAAAEIRGFSITRQGKRCYGDAIVEKLDPRGRKYYWIGGETPGFVPGSGTDFTMIEERRISITPLHLDLTNYAAIPELEGLEVEWP